MGVPVVAFHYRPDEMGYVSRYVTERVRVPDPWQNEAAFLQRLMDFSNQFGGSLLIPTDDRTLTALSMHKEILRTKYIVAADDWSIVSQCISKHYTYAVARAIGIPCPTGVVVRSSEDLHKCMNTIAFPCLVKPCESHKFYEMFRTKMFTIRNYDELCYQYERVSDSGLDVMVQEIIPGSDAEGVNYNSYFVGGAPVAEFTARKVRLEPPFFGSPRVIVSDAVPEIIEPGRALLRELKYSGFSCMEFKRDSRDGLYKFMEVNCRHNRSGSLAVACGINFPWIMYRHLTYGDIVSGSDFTRNVAWIEGTSDLVRSVISRKAERYTISEYLRPYRLKKVFAFLCIKDPLPFLKRYQCLIKLLLNNVKARLLTRTQVGVSAGAPSIK
jgi:predicted ATP-grasp superfamily ATP-dependent carboligase